MPRQKGPPTKPVRVYLADAERLDRLAADAGPDTTPAVVIKVMLDEREAAGHGRIARPNPTVQTTSAGARIRCDCPSPPTLSRFVTNLCTRCGRLRP